MPRMAELLREMEARGEVAAKAKGRPAKGKCRGVTTLPDLGISRDESARAKRLAEPSKTDFDRVVKAARATGALAPSASRVLSLRLPSGR